MGPKRIFAVRHAQAEHNVAEDYSIRDSPLTELGRSQAAQIPSQPLGGYANAHAQVIVTSPLRRTLQTTLIGFRPALTRAPPVPTVALPHLQECNDFPCDTGSSRAELEADPELKLFDFSGLTDDWNGKRGIYAANDSAWKERSRYARRWLRARPEETLVVVAHGDLLRWLTLGENDFSPWANTEIRCFEFAAGDDSQDEAALFRPITAQQAMQ